MDGSITTWGKFLSWFPEKEYQTLPLLRTLKKLLLQTENE